jgi:hypothetical protein
MFKGDVRFDVFEVLALIESVVDKVGLVGEGE